MGGQSRATNFISPALIGRVHSTFKNDNNNNNNNRYIKNDVAAVQV